MDDTRPMPVVPQNERVDYVEIAKEMVRQVVRDELSNYVVNLEWDVYVVWFAKTLKNWKAIVCTTMPDSLMFEVTHNGDLRETYIDTYKKMDNRKILDSEI